ncbi:hypothetical protein Tco_0982711 [Tanacetum coccineum]
MFSQSEALGLPTWTPECQMEASGTQSADVALPRRLTWDLHADVACHVAAVATVSGARYEVRYEVWLLMIGAGFVSTRLGSEPIIGSSVRGSGRYTWHEMVGGSSCQEQAYEA